MDVFSRDFDQWEALVQEKQQARVKLMADIIEYRKLAGKYSPEHSKLVLEVFTESGLLKEQRGLGQCDHLCEVLQHKRDNPGVPFLGRAPCGAGKTDGILINLAVILHRMHPEQTTIVAFPNRFVLATMGKRFERRGIQAASLTQDDIPEHLSKSI